MRGSSAKWDESIKELTLQGLTAREIAERLEVTMRTVQRGRRRTGVSLTDGGTNCYSPEFLAVAADRIADGWSFSEIAATYGVNQERLAAHFRGHGWTREQVAEFARLRKFEKRLYDAIDTKRYKVTYQPALADQLCRRPVPFGTVPGQSPTEAPPNAQIGAQRFDLVRAA